MARSSYKQDNTLKDLQADPESVLLSSIWISDSCHRIVAPAYSQVHRRTCTPTVDRKILFAQLEAAYQAVKKHWHQFHAVQALPQGSHFSHTPSRHQLTLHLVELASKSRASQLQVVQIHKRQCHEIMLTDLTHWIDKAHIRVNILLLVSGHKRLPWSALYWILQVCTTMCMKKPARERPREYPGTPLAGIPY